LERAVLGYSVEALSTQLNAVLRTEHLQPVILVGAGNLGSALLRYPGFAKEGFEVVAAFDVDCSRERRRELGVPLLPMEKMTPLVREKGYQNGHPHRAGHRRAGSGE
jgi:redox-sensing transcriptional repressor